MSRLGILGLIVRRSLSQHALSTLITILSTALACGLVMSVFSVARQSQDAFAGGPIGFDAVLGARGSPLQLVLNSVFHLETSPGNISWSSYEELRADRRVALAVPYAVGDNWHGYRIVGTTPELFTQAEGSVAPRPREGGRVFDPTRREAVIGSTVADRTGLGVGSSFHPTHGIVDDERHAHDEEYVVVGVLETTNSPSDRVVWIPIEGVFRMSGHVLRGTGESFEAQPGQAIADEHKEVSAVMLRLKSPQSGFQLGQKYNRKGSEATLAWPIAQVMTELFDKLGWVHRVLELVAYLVVAVAAGSILASLYNTMNERRREFAILRALGAKRRTVFAVIVMESATIAFFGALLGYAVYAAILATTASIVRERTGVALELWSGHPALVWTPLGMLLLGALAGLIPAWKAYATDVADNLQPTS